MSQVRRQPSEDSLSQRQRQHQQLHHLHHLQQPHQPHTSHLQHHHHHHQQQQHPATYKAYSPYTPYTCTPYSPPSPADPQQRGKGDPHSFKLASPPLTPASLFPRDYLAQRPDAANSSASSSDTRNTDNPAPGSHHNPSTYSSNFNHHHTVNFRSQAPVLSPFRTTTTTKASSTTTLYDPKSRLHLSSHSPSSPPSSSQPHGSALPRSPSLSQEDSPVATSPKSTPRPSRSGAPSSTSPISPRSPSPPVSPLSTSTFTRVSNFPIPPTTTAAAAAGSSTATRSLNQLPEAVQHCLALPDRLTGLSQVRGANGNMPKSSSYDLLRKASDPSHLITMNSNNNNSSNNNNNNNSNSNSNNGGRRVASANSVSPSPPLSNPALSSAVGDRVRTMPRTSSIDSAISSISSAHSHKSSLDANNVTPEDIANLISTVGSAEAVIIHLLKDKQQAASQNAQLWRLVDKQRTMVLGLNKDLERAMKDKDRYRKKLKELQANPPPIAEGAAHGSGEPATEGDNNSSKGSTSGHDLAKPSDTTMQISLDEPAIFPSDSHLAHSHTDPQLTRGGTPSSHPSSPSDSVRTEPLTSNNNTNHHPLRDSPTNLSMHEKQGESAEGLGSRGDNNNAINKTDLSSSTAPPANLRTGAPDYLKQTPPPLRRPPPAPLNLSQNERVHVQSQRINVAVGDDSDYDDNLDTDGIPRMENRGRRKTREEDDRQREALLFQEKAARSASNKMKAKLAQPPEGVQKNHQPPQGAAGMGPAGNRIVAHSPPPGLSQQIPPLDSLASMLSPRGSEAASSERDKLALSPPMSPGLPLSPRPGDRPLGSPLPRFLKDGQGNLASSPTSPRNGLPLSPRATKFPAPPFSGPTASTSTATGHNTLTKAAEFAIPSPTQNEAPRQDIPTFDASVKIDSPTSPYAFQSRIYRGLVSDQYPDLLLPPNALPSIDIKVSSSRLRPSRNSYLGLKPTDEEPVFTLSVFSRANRAELWRVEKVILALPQLDQQLKQAVPSFTGRLPDRSIFSGHSPAKVDARRAALNSYFEAILEMRMGEAGALVVCQFLTADAIEPRDDETNLVNGELKGKQSYPVGPDGKLRIEGYLTKRGKNFGGWKARYFVLDGPELKYYESPGGPHMGTIKIHHAQIGKQSQSTNSNQSPSRLDDESDNQYRHAFLILEPKKKDSTAFVRHVLCAESDEERDSWVEALLSYVEQDSDEEGSKHHRQVSKQDGTSKTRLLPGSSRKNNKDNDSPEETGSGDKLRSFSYDEVVAAEAPIRGPPGSVLPPGRGGGAAQAEPGYQHPWDQNMPQSPSLKSISGPTNGVKIQDAGAWGNKAPPPMSTKEKKRSIWGFRAATTADLANQIQSHEASSNNSPIERREPVRAVFGLPLAEAVEYCGVPGLNTGLPAVVYRCIDYLRAKDAALEEGIFRLSGSNVVIRSLKEKFNTEGDFDFLEGDTYYDVHAVASLFKQYLRELPTTVLTRDLHLDFIRVLDLDDKQKKIAAFNGLVHRLPRPNLTILKALSQYLIDIINNSDVNKMTVRNVGIVFAPTLNIPAPVFSMFLTDFESIFGESVSDFSIHAAAPVELLLDNKPLSPDDIRSPRHQMFSDLPTPSYNQSSFQQSQLSSSAAPQHRHKSDLTPQEAQHAHAQALTAQQQWEQQRDRDRSRDKFDNTGFIPIQPTYEQQMLGADPYNSMSSLLPPPSSSSGSNGNGNGNNNFNNSATSKAKRRESNLLFMNLGKKSGVSNLGGGQKGRDERSMVSEDSAFD
ncbi:RhoGAP domain-containing protein [Histoplasma capsulatum G186AR]|uniref:RhoGAP domain-containing protein n=2 Tax=Ajellomyces capsulatus TaxID=5037 RepID=C0P142_AJECG|nr:RhoGAP domain-containing protein [Histoplasma capsulatum G186AR]EEH02678.1 RhoGAP domain-containing protein [Histoplasma capsulatum G186AR]KAG5288411.1 RhoGAP domain-containing protein [Histoplasma capsulatum]QSS70987.1 RhoGAP domain-containing protein [Histoplasma capsulatum G186AR]